MVCSVYKFVCAPLSFLTTKANPKLLSILKMKTTIIFFLVSTCFLPLAISALPPLIRLPNEAAESPVLDAGGNPVVTGANYYAYILGEEGGINVANFNNPTACPTDVFLNLGKPGVNPQALSRPISFYPFGGATGAVHEVVPLNVAFYESDPSNPCANLTVWKLDDKKMVVTGGVIGDYDDVNNWFSIRRYSHSSLVNSYIFFRVGTVDGLRRLGLNDDSQTPFVFVKAAM